MNIEHFSCKKLILIQFRLRQYLANQFHTPSIALCQFLFLSITTMKASFVGCLSLSFETLCHLACQDRYGCYCCCHYATILF